MRDGASEYLANQHVWNAQIMYVFSAASDLLTCLEPWHGAADLAGRHRFHNVHWSAPMACSSARRIWMRRSWVLYAADPRGLSIVSVSTAAASAAREKVAALAGWPRSAFSVSDSRVSFSVAAETMTRASRMVPPSTRTETATPSAGQ